MVTSFKFNTGDVVYNTESKKYGTILYCYEDSGEKYYYLSYISSQDSFDSLAPEFALRKYAKIS